MNTDQVDKFHNYRPIVVIAAMEVEFKYLLEKLENVKLNQVNKFNFYEGSINKYPTVICHCYVNTINATLATYIAIDKYNPIAIVNEGTAGAHGKKVHKNDIIIGLKCLNSISIKTPPKKEGEGSDSLEWKLTNFAYDEKDDQVDYQFGDQNLLKVAQSIEYSNGHVHIGVISSGDVWNREADRILWYNAKFNSLCEEMECYAIYTVANNFKVPAIAIKVISNNEILNEPFDENTAVNSQKFAYDFILLLIKEYV